MKIAINISNIFLQMFHGELVTIIGTPKRASTPTTGKIFFAGIPTLMELQPKFVESISIISLLGK